MPVFRYQALTAKGEQTKGIVDADTAKEAREKLRGQKVFVTESAVEESIARMAASYNRTVEDMTEYLEQRDMLGSLRSRMREEQVIALLREKIKIEE